MKLIELTEFREAGFLQEANRKFFHPLGLALTLVHDDETNEDSLVIQDHRDDAEGVLFTDLSDDETKRKHEAVLAVALGKRFERLVRCGGKLEMPRFGDGWAIQEIGHKLPES